MLRKLPQLYHRYAVGDLAVTQLRDGAVDHGPAHAFFGVNASRSDFESLSTLQGISTDRFDFPATITCVDSGEERVLIDAGHGHLQRPHAGLLVEAMRQSDIEADSVTQVVISHLHGDHFGGLVGPDGKPVFKNAQHWISPLETAYWLGPSGDQAIAANARDLVEALGDQLAFITPGDEVAPGVSIVDSAGHTPGHVSVMLSSAGHRMLVTGDVANHPVWAIMRPHWTMSLDVNPEQASRTRLRLLSMLADQGILMAGYHMPFPGIGTVTRSADEDDVFLFTPLEG